MEGVKNWPAQRAAIIRLIDHLDEKLPTLHLDAMASSTFTGALALYRCNRFLRAIDLAVENGSGDTAGGDLRSLYDNWILGHLLMLGSHEEARALWGMTRGRAETLLRRIGADSEVEYPEEAPEAVQDNGVEQRAAALRQKLETDDPANADMPEHCYNFIYRAESHLSAHANLDGFSQYVVAVGKADSTIGLQGRNENCEWRTLLGAYITLYFAQRIFTRGDIDTTVLDEVEGVLDPDLDTLPQPDAEA